MIEKTVLDFLESELAPVGVYAERPEDPPEKYVLIEKTGGSSENLIKSAVIAVQSYAPSLLQAAELNEDVKTAMAMLPWLISVSRCSLNSDYNFTNNETKEYRYQAVFNIVYY